MTSVKGTHIHTSSHQWLRCHRDPPKSGRNTRAKDPWEDKRPDTKAQTMANRRRLVILIMSNKEPQRGQGLRKMHKPIPQNPDLKECRQKKMEVDNQPLAGHNSTWNLQPLPKRAKRTAQKKKTTVAGKNLSADRKRRNGEDNLGVHQEINNTKGQEILPS